MKDIDLTEISADDWDEMQNPRPAESDFDRVVEEAISRRGFLGSVLAFGSGAAVMGAGTLLSSTSAKAQAAGRFAFTPIPIQTDFSVHVPDGYSWAPVAKWGQPLFSDAEPFDPATGHTAANASKVFGENTDGMWLYSIDGHEVIAVNNEYANRKTNLNYEGDAAGTPQSLEDVRLFQGIQGVTIFEVAPVEGGGYEIVLDSRFNRRIDHNTPMEITGPARGHEMMKTAADPDGVQSLGTMNNCGSGPTPWGTYLTCEENFNGYFGSESGGIGGFDDLQDAAYARYGFSTGGFGYGWHVFDERFDLANPMFANESNRFGWIVEIDPYDGRKKPAKRTALGRFKHEAAAVKELADGRVAVYMGDDQRGDYCYKYESRLQWRKAIDRGLSPLDDGKLYVARFAPSASGNEDNGTGEWVELTPSNPDIAAAGLVTEDLVLVYARIAADAVGATRMDRPEWSTLGANGEIYWTLTNNDRKDRDPPQGAVSEVNPIFENTDGYIIKTEDTSATTFSWNMFLISRNTRSEDPGGDDRDVPYAGYTPPADGGANVFTDPDCAWADPFGRLFIGTDGGQPDGLQDQLVVIDTNTGEYRRLLVGVASDEITGCIATPNYRTLFTNTQHPGNGDPTATNFPAADDGVTIPRDCTLVVTKKNGGIVGS